MTQPKSSPQSKQSESQMLISYMLLRKLIGALGVALPFALVIGGIIYGKCEFIENSISDYYHTEMRNVLVGTLCAVALFMFAYRGHDRRDSIAGNLACVFALGVAFFPTSVDTVSECATNCIFYEPWISYVHFASALFFFCVLIYFCLFLFVEPRKREYELSQEKKKRNMVFRISGYIMIFCILCIAVYFIFFDEDPEIKQLDVVFWFEAIALLAFGISWLTKGQLVLKDKPETSAE